MQWVVSSVGREQQRTFNPLVEGSNPSRPTTSFSFYILFNKTIFSTAFPYPIFLSITLFLRSASQNITSQLMS